jgi:hypothetical protein
MKTSDRAARAAAKRAWRLAWGQRRAIEWQRFRVSGEYRALVERHSREVREAFEAWMVQSLVREPLKLLDGEEL